MSEMKPGEVRVFQRERDQRWAVGVDAPELEGELRVATERDATPVARFVAQALAALRGADALVLTRGEFAAVKTVHAAIQAAAAEKFGDVVRSATDDVVKASLVEIEAAIRASERERIRQLAAAHHARYDETKPCNCGRVLPGGRPCTVRLRSDLPFADLIGEKA